MGLFKRLARIWKADLHGLMDALEDKDLLLRQCLREMEEARERGLLELARLEAQRRQGGVEAERMRCRLDRVESDLELALASGRDPLCRALIAQRRALETRWDNVAAELADTDAQLAALRERVEGEDAALAELRARVDEQMRLKSLDRHASRDNEPSLPATLDVAVELELLQRKQHCKAPGRA